MHHAEKSDTGRNALSSSEKHVAYAFLHVSSHLCQLRAAELIRRIYDICQQQDTHHLLIEGSGAIVQHLLISHNAFRSFFLRKGCWSIVFAWDSSACAITAMRDISSACNKCRYSFLASKHRTQQTGTLRVYITMQLFQIFLLMLRPV